MREHVRPREVASEPYWSGGGRGREDAKVQRKDVGGAAKPDEQLPAVDIL